MAHNHRVAVTPEEKNHLRAAGGSVVEMEAAAVAAVAQRAGVPFYCIRAVSDGAGEALGLDFNEFRDARGRFSRFRIAMAAVRRPSVIPALIRLDRNCRRAAENSGAFLADCRF